MTKIRNFRVWDISRGRYLADTETSLHAFTDYYLSLWGQLTAFEGAISESPVCSQTKVDKDNFIIEEFVGIKDVDGKDIYEGDILESPIGWMYPKMHGEVKWDKKELNMVFECKPYSTLWNISLESNRQYKIIGNIHKDKRLIYKNNQPKDDGKRAVF
jgi:hypothetical protein